MPLDSSVEHANWFVEDLPRILSIWLKNAPEENGYFHSQFDREWKRSEERVGTLVSQTRLIYTMSTGFALTGDDAYAKAASAGVDFLEAHFRDREQLGYFYSVAPDGTLVDDDKHSYGHSFVIFSLAEAALALDRPEYATRSREVWDEYRKGFGDRNGGFYNRMTRGFEPSGEPLSQNPIMHLFEALLSLSQTPPGEGILADAVKVADFVTGTLVDAKTGFLPEIYNTNWTPLKEEDGNRVDVGHAFEWAFLLSHAVRLGAPKRLLSFAHQFLDAGLTVGFDRERGLVFSPASLDGNTVKRTNGYWEQCEALRTMFHFAAIRDRPEMEYSFDSLAKFVRAHYVDPEHGGWYSSVTPKGSALDTTKGRVWKLDYHQTSMTVELKRILDSVTS